MINLHLLLIKTDCTIKYTRPKLSENSPFQVSNINHDQRNNYQVTLTFMENQGKSLKKSDLMKYDNITVLVIYN